jgi:D-cysteine desulfhydrase
MSMPIPARSSLARLPTPVQKLERLSAELGLELWVKRDDQTGLELSGNKVRKLEFLVHDALEKGATCLITCGGVQSNHCRATAALAARLGLRCVLLLRGEEPDAPGANFLLDKIFGAEVFFLSSTQYYEGMGELRVMLDSQIRSQGGKAYFIPEGGSNGLGCFGYAEAFREIEEQRRSGGIPGLTDHFETIVTAHGSGGTQSGLLLGRLLMGAEAPETRVVGVNVCYDRMESFRLVKDSLWEAIQQFRLPLSFFAEEIEILDGFLGRGYALSTREELDFLTKVGRMEGLLLDPVYTGKALLGLYNTAKASPGFFGKRVLFLHTGGIFGLFRQEKEWGELLR